MVNHVDILVGIVIGFALGLAIANLVKGVNQRHGVVYTYNPDGRLESIMPAP